MNRIYLDNAATTPIHPEVVDEMIPFLREKFGNPSSIYSFGRETRMAIEQARKSVALHIGASPSEVFFTSGGTESSNASIKGVVEDLGVTHIISSAIEHHATLHSVEYLAQAGKVHLDFVNLLEEGVLDYNHLEELLQSGKGKTLVTLMHANNEIGNLLDAERVGALCKKYNAFFHCDAVQTLAHYPLDVKKMGVHFLSGAGHKFHGPKGIGILYMSKESILKPIIHGGSQERNLRAGTENVASVVGFAKALDIAVMNYDNDRNYISELKTYMVDSIKKELPNVIINGDFDNSLYTVLNVCIPNTPKAEMLIMNFDIKGICVSGGSACSSGAESVSHVIKAIRGNADVIPIRFSFNKWNTMEEIDFVLQTMKELM
jgi:cysteine desulfurase